MIPLVLLLPVLTARFTEDGAVCLTCGTDPGTPCCNPNTTPPQECPGGVLCCNCGTDACQCGGSPPPPTPPTPPTPPPPPAPTDPYIEAIKWTDYEIGYCSAISPNGNPPSPPGYWCSDFNRGYNEKACWTATQNCCYFDANKTIPQYPGTGQCVHTDPCWDRGEKICGGVCHKLFTGDGMMTCVRGDNGTGTPMYSTELCVMKTPTTPEEVADFLTWVCNPANSQLNCKMINGGGANNYETPGLTPKNSASDPGTYTQGSWALNQFYLLTGQCNSLGRLVTAPKNGPPTVKTPAPVGEPTPTPTKPPPPYKGTTTLFGVGDCSLNSGETGSKCAGIFSEWVGGVAAVGVVEVGWDDPGKIPSVFSSLIEPMWEVGVVPMIDWLPYPYGSWTNPSPNVDIVNGAYDLYIKAFYGNLTEFLAVNTNRKVYLRFAPEANGDFYPWSPRCPSCASTGQHINQTTASYVNMWRYVKSLGAMMSPSTVQWVWTVNNEDAPDGSASIENVCPEDYDWATVSGFNWGTTIPGHSWEDPEEVYGGSLKRLAKISSGKPLGVTGLGSVSTPNGVAAKGTWYTTALTLTQTLNLSMVLVQNDDGSSDLSALGGKNGDYTAAVDGRTLQGYKEIPSFLGGGGWAVAPGTAADGIISEKTFKTGRA